MVILNEHRSVSIAGFFKHCLSKQFVDFPVRFPVRLSEYRLSIDVVAQRP